MDERATDEAIGLAGSLPAVSVTGVEPNTPAGPADAADEPPVVSVVVSTFHRPAGLRALLEGLENQTLPLSDFEVVVVDNGSADDTWEVLQNIARSSSLHLQTLRHDRNRGPAAGRNTGWRAARAPLIAFTDDDCVPTPGWLEAGIRAMHEPNRLVVGLTTPNPAQRSNLGPFSRTQEVRDTTFMQTCNMFYARADLEAVNGFDELIKAKGGEDTDLGWRVCDLGRSVIFDAQAHVHHDITPSAFRNALCEATAWVDIPRVKIVHPVRARGVFYGRIFWKRSHATAFLGLLALVFGVLSRRRFLVVGLLPWLRIHLRNVRFGPRRVYRLALAPHAFLIDVVEITTMIRGSIKHRTLVL